MDAAGLRSRIQAVLDTNADIRRQAELELKHVSRSHLCTSAGLGFAGFVRGTVH